jgi:integrase
MDAVAQKYLAAKQASVLRPRSMARLRAHLDRFLIGRREIPISDITADQVREFIGGNGWSPATARGNLGDLVSFFNWAVKNGLATSNPAAAVDKPRLDEKPPGILTPSQAEALLHVCRVAEPALLPTLTLCLLSGVRPDEARRLSWENVGADVVEIPGAKAKTRRRRTVPITPQVRAWLDVARIEGGGLPVANYPNLFARVRRLTGLASQWPQDAMRHSFASYHLALHHSEGRTALEMGTSPQMLFQHYRELVTAQAAEAFFGIMPAPKAEADEVAGKAAALAGQPSPAKLSRRSYHNRGSRQVTKTALGAVFGHGSKHLTRAEARAALCDIHGLAPSTADAALSPSGRYRQHLLEAPEGRVAWVPFPSRPSIYGDGRPEDPQ